MTPLLLAALTGWAVLAGCSPEAPPSSTVPADATTDTGTPNAGRTADTGTSIDSTVARDTQVHPTGSTADTAPTTPTGCGLSPPQSGAMAFDHDGVSRSYALHLPASYDPNTPAPLLLAFHGWGGTEQEYLSSNVVTQLTSDRGYVLVVPRGLGSGPPDQSFNSWSFRGSTTGLDGDGLNPGVPNDSPDTCDDALTADYTYPSCAGTAANGCSWTHCQDDDVDFVVDLLDALQAELCIDAQRIYATGGSNGGMFTWELAQNPVTAPRLRAVAPLIGLPHRGYLDTKGRADDLPVLLVTGSQDRTVPPGDWDDPTFTVTTDGDRYFYTGATAITQAFAAGHGCSTTGDAVPYDVGNPELDCRTHCDADPGWPRVLDCRIQMGHTYSFSTVWPLMLDFFDAWP